jgi:hypothetical protein
MSNLTDLLFLISLALPPLTVAASIAAVLFAGRSRDRSPAAHEVTTPDMAIDHLSAR